MWLDFRVGIILSYMKLENLESQKVPLNGLGTKRMQAHQRIIKG